MKLLICPILISMMIFVLGCDTPAPKPISRKTPAAANKEIQTEQSVAKEYTITDEDKQLINTALQSGQLSDENWELFLDRLQNEPDPASAVKNALDNSFTARLRRSRTKWRRQLLTPR